VNLRENNKQKAGKGVENNSPRGGVGNFFINLEGGDSKCNVIEAAKKYKGVVGGIGNKTQTGPDQPLPCHPNPLETPAHVATCRLEPAANTKLKVFLELLLMMIKNMCTCGSETARRCGL